MNDAIAGDQARVTVSVALAPAETFDVFTREIDLWWRRGPKYRHAGGPGALIAIEPRAGGRIFESRAGADGSEPVQEVGRVRVWEPPRRLVFEWRNAAFAAAEQNEVEVLFEASAGGTRVTLTHRGWAAIRADHPVRHAQPVPAFVRSLGLWWGDQLGALRLHAAAGATGSTPSSR